ncbi:hypothetical protein Pcinc_021090 [Petrolisthes cinctipes]|uniref:Uncharacterized protein n=1 Tax=Petrolisthes cinctipes TaxID=88211 RepID=A0AAE1FKU7_PETCI|nr:hypothetical protein Pcinc_021090 [Petrolisthes cinctipes]
MEEREDRLGQLLLLEDLSRGKLVLGVTGFMRKRRKMRYLRPRIRLQGAGYRNRVKSESHFCTVVVQRHCDNHCLLSCWGSYGETDSEEEVYGPSSEGQTFFIFLKVPLQ